MINFHAICIQQQRKKIQSVIKIEVKSNPWAALPIDIAAHGHDILQTV